MSNILSPSGFIRAINDKVLVMFFFIVGLSNQCFEHLFAAAVNVLLSDVRGERYV